ncbi:MAG TPA: hypothetical protein VLL08_16010 [Kineosporiaceae bacterium]|nr:hypothetical protein [Kineosporiaceae bacterium]
MLSYAASLGVFGADPKVITVPNPDTVSPGFLGFAVMFLLAVATILLIRSMVAHLRKVRYLPEPEEQQNRNSRAT